MRLAWPVRTDLPQHPAVKLSDPAPQPEQKQAAPVVEMAKDEIAPDILVVIATAVHAVLGGRPHRIHSVTHSVGMMAHMHFNQPAWSVEGRRQIFQSHKIR